MVSFYDPYRSVAKVYSQFAQSHFARIFPRFVHSFFALSNFALFPFRPRSVLPFCCFAQFHFRPFFISPGSHLAQLSHFALYPQGPFPSCPNGIFLISGPKTNKKFSNNLIPQFWTLFWGFLWTAHIIGEENILVILRFFYQYGYSYKFLGI